MRASSRFTGACEQLGEIYIADLVSWFTSIEQAWHKGSDRPLVMVDPAFLQSKTDRVVEVLMQLFPACHAGEHQLTILNPGDYVPYHTDQCLADWITRVHVPIVTNPDCWFLTDGLAHHMEVGMAYEVNPSRPHAVANFGSAVRAHLMFDVLQ
jgi:hypothetical protein